jgi:hypothetical protein
MSGAMGMTAAHIGRGSLQTMLPPASRTLI